MEKNSYELRVRSEEVLLLPKSKAHGAERIASLGLIEFVGLIGLLELIELIESQ